MTLYTPNWYWPNQNREQSFLNQNNNDKQTNQKKKEIESGSSLARTKHDKYMQQEHKLSVFLLNQRIQRKLLNQGT